MHASEVVVVFTQQTLSGWEPVSRFDMKNILQLSLAWRQSTSAQNKGAPKAERAARPPRSTACTCVLTAPKAPGLRLGQRISFAVGLLHLKNTEGIHQVMRASYWGGFCFTTVKTKIICHLKCVFRAIVQGPSPAVSIIRGKLMKCEVLWSFRIEKGPLSHCILNCIFPFKACVLILHCGPGGPAPLSCLGPAEVGEGKGDGGQGPGGSVSQHWTVCRELLCPLSFPAGTTLTGVGFGVEDAQVQSLHMSLGCHQYGSCRHRFPVLINTSSSSLLCSASNCLLSRPLLLTHEVSIRDVQEFWDLGVWLSSVTALIKTLTSVVLFLGDNLSVRVKPASRITPLLNLSVPKYFSGSPSYWNAASSVCMGSSSQTANKILQKNKVKNSHWNFAFGKEFWCPKTGEVFLLASNFRYFFT